MKNQKIGIIGCGDYLRWQSQDLKNSKNVKVKSLFDPDKARSAKFAKDLGGKSVGSSDEILNDKEISIVCVFVPPWIRKDILVKAANAGKHIITTKPLAPSIAECRAMVDAVKKNNVKCGVFYRRTGNSGIETYKRIFSSGKVGKLALYKQDWIHHYPEWNNWATDPEKNGGPFMDAMIHNMNISKYLMGRKPVSCSYFSENFAHPGLKCSDTDFMKLDFEKNGAAHLFITWAADLAVHSRDGNDREHIDIVYMITDKGWRITEAWEKEGFTITASRSGKNMKWIAKDFKDTTYDRFADSVLKNKPLPSDIPDVTEASEDIKLIRDAEKSKKI